MNEKKDFQAHLSDLGTVERILACIEFSKALVSAYDMETLLKAVLERISILIPASNWSLLLRDQKTGDLYFAVTVGLDPERLKGIRLKMGEGIAGVVAQTGKPAFIADARKNPRFSPKVDEVTGFETRSIIALPLHLRGEVVGVFEVVNIENQDFFREKYLPLLNILADYVAIAVDNVRNMQKLQARTFIDEVTGFYNTRYLSAKLDQFIRDIINHGGELSVVFLDLDNFKAIVDSQGHLRGSKVLSEVARVLHSVLGPEDSLVRYGGDEFIVLLPHQNQEQALNVVQALRRKLNSTRFLAEEGVNVRVTASYGIATMPQDAKDKESLLLIADRAMFRCKESGKDCIMVGHSLAPLQEASDRQGQVPT
ncbi:MAG: sensor domain-containing diguanylate cyclase [Deltaproteobacteria bacterium]|nr:sensor domain-containing diguanylate cyclase [Deltaproteobacteria bacterium]